MAKGRAVVMEVAGKRAIVLDQSGLFRRVAAADSWRVGDEVWMDPPAPAAPHPLWGVRSRWAVAAVICALLIVAVPLGHEMTVSAQTAAIVTFDINPSVQLALNSSGRVLYATALDSGGAQLLQGLRVRGMTLSAAVSELTDRATAQGYVNQTTIMPVMLAVAPATGSSLPAAVTQQEAQARTAVAQHLQKKGYKVAVDALTAQRSDADHAKALHLSLGRYLVYEAAQHAGVKVTPAALRARSIVAALRHAGASEAAIQQVLTRIGEDTLHAAESGTVRPQGGDHGRGGAKAHGAAPTATASGPSVVQPETAAATSSATSSATESAASSATESEHGRGRARTGTASASQPSGSATRTVREATASSQARNGGDHGKSGGRKAEAGRRGASLTEQVWRDLQRFFERNWSQPEGKRQSQPDQWFRANWIDSRQSTQGTQHARKAGGHGQSQHGH